MTYAAIIKNAREAANMTQIHLAQAAGLSKRTVIRAEAGEPISAETIRALASVLNIDLAQVAHPEEPKDPLYAQIEAVGETIIWEGAPDRKKWETVAKVHAWAAASYALAALSFATITIYALAAMHAFVSGHMASAILGLLGAVACFVMALKVIASHNRSLTRRKTMDVTRLILTDSAFYKATSDASSAIQSLSRLPINSRWTRVEEKAAYVLWPRAKVVEIVTPQYDPLYIAGVDGLDKVIEASIEHHRCNTDALPAAA